MNSFFRAVRDALETPSGKYARLQAARTPEQVAFDRLEEAIFWIQRLKTSVEHELSDPHRLKSYTSDPDWYNALEWDKHVQRRAKREEFGVILYDALLSSPRYTWPKDVGVIFTEEKLLFKQFLRADFVSSVTPR